MITTRSLFHRLAIFAAVAACFGALAAGADAAPLVWTASPSGESVRSFDGASGREVGAPIPVGEGPSSLAVTPNGRRAVVLTGAGQSAEVIETATRKVVGKPIPLGRDGLEVAISPDGKTAYAIAVGDEDIHLINPETASAIGTIDVGGETEALALSPDGSRAYVGVFPGKIVTVDTAAKSVVGNPIEIGGNPESIALTSDGGTAYVTAGGVKGVLVIDTALNQVVKTIPTTETPSSIAVSPDGRRLYIADATPNSISVAEIATNAIVGKPIAVPAGATEIALTADGRTAWATGTALTPVDLVGEKAGTAIATGEVAPIAITPDQSPIAAFTPPTATVGTPALFSGAASSDPDGTVAAWNWTFGDGGAATGVGPSYTFLDAGTFNTKLSVVDNEGCGEAEVFTGRTAYCSGNVGAAVTHPVTAQPAPQAVTVTTQPSNAFRFGRVIHNRANGTVRMQVRLPSAGFVLLFGKKVHAVTRKSKGVQMMWLTIHARVELAKRLKQTRRAPVSVRVTFTPNGGTPKTVHRTVTLQRKPHKKPKHHHPAR